MIYRRITYGLGGFDSTKPNNNVIEDVLSADVPDSPSETLRARALTALDTNRTFIAIQSPTNAQLAAQVTALTHQNVGIIRLLLGLLDGID